MKSETRTEHWNIFRQQLDPRRLPRHIAIIMDGNGRWAQRRHLPRIMGHRAGMRAVKEIIRATYELNIPYLTLFAFSTENWQRPENEVQALLQLLRKFINQELTALQKNGVHLDVWGEWQEFPPEVRKEIEQAIALTRTNQRLCLNVALNYGGRNEIVRAVNRIIAEGASQVTSQSFSGHLYSANIPDPDLLIRTSGEQRISNFLLWQSAYSEFYFSPVYWPEFNRQEFYKALLEYQKRERRFGEVET